MIEPFGMAKRGDARYNRYANKLYHLRWKGETIEHNIVGLREAERLQKEYALMGMYAEVKNGAE